MTDIDDVIVRVRRLDAEATKGPWMSPNHRLDKPDCGYVYRAEGMASQVARTMSTTRGRADAALIAEYRTACPLLANEVANLRDDAAIVRAEVERLRAEVQSLTLDAVLHRIAMPRVHVGPRRNAGRSRALEGGECGAEGGVSRHARNSGRLRAAHVARAVWNVRRLPRPRRARRCQVSHEEYFAVVRWGDEAHGGPGWYYYDTEYPEEGSCGPYATEAEARAAARAVYDEMEGTQ